MATAKDYLRNKDGQRLDFRGMNTVLPPDELPEGKYPYAQNVRRYIKGGIVGRATLTQAIFPPPPRPPGPTPAIVQSWGNCTSLATGQHNFTLNVTIGDCVIVFVSVLGPHTATGISDGTGNIYTLLRGPDFSANDGTGTGLGVGTNNYIFACFSTIAVPGIYSVTGPVGNFFNLAALDISGFNNDAGDTFTAILAAVTAWNGAAINTTQANRLLLSFASYKNGSGQQDFTVGAGWTQLVAIKDGGARDGSGLLLQTRNAASAGAYPNTCTLSAAYPGSMEAIALGG